MLVEDLLNEALSPTEQAVLKIVKAKFVELVLTLDVGKTTGSVEDPALWSHPVGRPYLYDGIIAYIRAEINKMERGKVKNWWYTYYSRFKRHYGDGGSRIWKKTDPPVIAMFASRWLQFTINSAIKIHGVDGITNVR